MCMAKPLKIWNTIFFSSGQHSLVVTNSLGTLSDSQLNKLTSLRGWQKHTPKTWTSFTRYFIPVTIENRTCDISSATIGTLFLCCVRVWTKIQERCCLFCFGTSVLCMQRKSRNFCINNNTHDARREKPSKTGESSKKPLMFLLA